MTSRAGDEFADVAIDLAGEPLIHCRSHSGTLNESTIVGVKTSRPRGRGSRAVDLGSMVTETMNMVFYPGSGPLDGGKILRPALVYIDEYEYYKS